MAGGDGAAAPADGAIVVGGSAFSRRIAAHAAQLGDADDALLPYGLALSFIVPGLGFGFVYSVIPLQYYT